MITKIQIKKILILSFILILTVIAASCSFSSTQEASENGSVYFVIDENMEHSIRTAIGRAHNGTAYARAASTAISKEDLYIDVSLKGGHEETITVPVKAGETASFENIPAGLSLYAEAKAYFIEGGEKVVFYEGKSSTVTVEEGENTIPISLKKADNPEAWGQRIYIREGLNINGERDGSKEKPYESLHDALTSLVNEEEERDYVFIVQGEIQSGQNLRADLVGELHVSSIILKGEDSSAAIKGSSVAQNCINVALDIIPLTIKNIAFKDNVSETALYIQSDTTIGKGVSFTNNMHAICVNYTYLNISENVIFHNKYADGHSIIAEENAIIYLSGNAKLVGDNEITLGAEIYNHTPIYISSMLKESGPIARITPKYEYSFSVLEAKPGVPLQPEKFTVTPQMENDYFEVPVYWKINSEGALVRITNVTISRTNNNTLHQHSGIITYTVNNMETTDLPKMVKLYYLNGTDNWNYQTTGFEGGWTDNVYTLEINNLDVNTYKIEFYYENCEPMCENYEFYFQVVED